MRVSIRGASAVVLALGLAAAAPARAQNANTTPNVNRGNTAGGTGARGEETVRGLIAGVTTAGETVINLETGRGEAAQVAYLTIIGSRDWGRDDRDSDRSRGDDKDRSDKNNDKDRGQASMPKLRDNVYILTLSPTAKVREASGWSKQAVDSAATASFDRFELGDCVQVTYRPSETGRPASPNGTKHGRHRMYRGEITAITILPHHQGDHRGPRSDQGHQASGSERSSSSGSSSDKK
jgi:hypothetical protein